MSVASPGRVDAIRGLEDLALDTETALPMPNKDAGKPHRERVLIVEDDEAARVGLQQLVGKWGFIVETAGDGREALLKLPAFDPGIVLTDS